MFEENFSHINIQIEIPLSKINICYQSIEFINMWIDAYVMNQGDPIYK